MSVNNQGRYTPASGEEEWTRPKKVKPARITKVDRTDFEPTIDHFREKSSPQHSSENKPVTDSYCYKGLRESAAHLVYKMLQIGRCHDFGCLKLNSHKAGHGRKHSEHYSGDVPRQENEQTPGLRSPCPQRSG